MFKISTLLLLCAAAFALADDENGFFDQETDAIVIEASAASDDDFGRSGRQFFPQQQPILISHPIFGALGGGIRANPVQTKPVVPAQSKPESPEETDQQQVDEEGGTPCETKDGRAGKCTDYNSCYPYFKTFNLTADQSWVMGSFDSCSYQVESGRQLRGICCTKEPPRDTDDPVSGEDVAPDDPFFGDFPIEFSEVNVDCGKRPNFNNIIRIINGQEASLNEYPFMAAMINRGKQFCGGTLVDDIHILTAAHCVAHMSKYDVQNLRVVLGDHNLKLSVERGVTEYAVKRVIRHKNFDNVKLYNDVAILTLAKPVDRSGTVQPICLETDSGKNFEGENVYVAGWGTTSSGASRSSDVLRKVDVEVWSNSECDSSYGKNAPGGIKESMICANLRTSKVHDSCSGDSGGPLFKCDSRNSGCTQIGIVSWGIGCAKKEYPGVYTRVTSLMPWIKKIVKKY